MKTLTLTAIATAMTLSLYGCGGDSGDNKTATSQVSFYVSDAPVDSAEEVMITVEQIEVTSESGETYTYDVTEGNNAYAQFDILDYQGTERLLIAEDFTLPVGEYKSMTLHVVPDSTGTMNYVLDNQVQHPLKQPSNKLKLGGFEVTVEGTQGFTIEFDLRKSLVERGVDAKNGYILKPHGISIHDNTTVARLSGTVSSALYTGDNCPSDTDEITNGFVYLYANHGLEIGSLVDNLDPTDEEFVGDLPTEGYQVPVASTSVDSATGAYEFGYLESGQYTIAYTCNGLGDDPINWDMLDIPYTQTSLDTGNDGIEEVELTDGMDKIVDLDAVQP
ncbi:DUF4382 domain-containing protein [Vibrio superstes]|uniref:DUF4382 domain-containing protein n=1 Tax=Vibrio superstes NBRC 103154 TaxID=1219062 RepID=A0A511QSJ8_9VIBR|nr:DUF4382 domain-containing protein [Vibrio superstes]GEM80329.1 hypothetical protein VSU01S_25740 [Vibrio superstes NBRC 103154]